MRAFIQAPHAHGEIDWGQGSDILLLCKLTKSLDGEKAIDISISIAVIIIGVVDDKISRSCIGRDFPIAEVVTGKWIKWML